MKVKIQIFFLSFFKTRYVKHLVYHKPKEIKQMWGESVREYNKIFKDLLGHIPHTVDKEIPVQWFVVGVLQKICAPLRMHEIQTCKDALKKSQHIELDEDWTTTIIDKGVE
jgi:hypothetical protein